MSYLNYLVTQLQHNNLNNQYARLTFVKLRMLTISIMEIINNEIWKIERQEE